LDVQSHHIIEEHQEGRRLSLDLTQLQAKLLNLDAVVNSTYNPIRHKKCQNSHNLYLAIHKYDPELTYSALRSTSVSPGLDQNYSYIPMTHEIEKWHDDTMTFMYEVSIQNKSESTFRSQKIVHVSPKKRFKEPHPSYYSFLSSTSS
jgi:hypothetical protein